MIYLDNIIFSLQKHGGVSVVWENLINKLLREKENVQFLEFRDAEDNEVRKTIAIPDNKIIKRNTLPILLERFRDVHISDNIPGILHSSHYRISTNPLVKNISTVHDFTYEFYFNGISKKIICWQKYRAIRNSEVVICISENTKRDLLRFLPDIKEDRIRVIYNGVSDAYHQLEDNEKRDYEDYILFVGGRQSYKNFAFAVECAKSIRKRLLIVGGRLTDKELEILNNTLGPDGYKLIIHPSDEELNEIYNSVDCLLYPSLYEGFGIPVIEAQRAGCPVIALNASSIPEIIGNPKLLLDQSDLTDFKRVYGYVHHHSKEVVDEGLQNARKFSWDKMATEYLDTYKEILH